MLLHQLPLDAASAAVRSAPTGLSRAEAAERRLEFGPNRIERLPETPVAIRFLRQFTHFFAALLWVAAVLALMADWWMPGQGMRTTLQNEIAKLSRMIAALAVSLGLAVFVIGWFIGLPTAVSVVFAIGIIVANVPEGQLPTVTLAMAMAARRMARRNTLVRHLPSVETLGCASVICTDKTGTLTQNRMEIRSVYTDGGFAGPAATVTPAFAAGHRRFLECAGCCHDLRNAGESGDPRWLGDPMELALAQMAVTALGGRSWTACARVWLSCAAAGLRSGRRRAGSGPDGSGGLRGSTTARGASRDSAMA